MAKRTRAKKTKSAKKSKVVKKRGAKKPAKKKAAKKPVKAPVEEKRSLPTEYNLKLSNRALSVIMKLLRCESCDSTRVIAMQCAKTAGLRKAGYSHEDLHVESSNAIREINKQLPAVN